MPTLAEKVALVRASQSKKVTSEDTTPTPLWVYLAIIEKARYECSINYMQGAKYLASYLAPVQLPELPKLVSYKLPAITSNWALTEVATILMPPELDMSKDVNSYLFMLRKIEYAILQESVI